MNLAQLRFATAVAAERSFSRAAEGCHVTQPTLSNGVAQLEQELGGQLFMRTTRKVELSPFGAQVLPLIEAVLHAQAELEAGVRAFHDPAHRIARIGLSQLVDARLVNQVLEPYRAESAGIETFLKECFLDDMDARLGQGQVDMALRPRLADAPLAKTQASVPFYGEDLFYLPRRADDTATASGPVTVREVAGETFVLGPDGCGLVSTTRALFRGQGLELREYSGEALSFQVMQDWADIGIGATILPRSKLAPQFAKRARPLLLDAETPARVDFVAIWVADAAYPAHVERLHRHFAERVPALVAGTGR